MVDVRPEDVRAGWSRDHSVYRGADGDFLRLGSVPAITAQKPVSMTVYWTSTKSPVHLFKQPYESEVIAEHLKEHSFVDAAILADELGLHNRAVEAYQLRLGIRRITTRKDYK
jgi:hypothetical protein